LKCLAIKGEIQRRRAINHSTFAQAKPGHAFARFFA
jgi:hypothetical protein